MNQLQKMGALLHSIREIILQGRQLAFKNNNSILLNTYSEIGRLIVEDEQERAGKAAYGKGLLKALSRQLTLEFGKGYLPREEEPAQLPEEDMVQYGVGY